MIVKEQAVCRQCHRAAAFSLTMTEVLREGGKGCVRYSRDHVKSVGGCKCHLAARFMCSKAQSQQ